MRGGEDYIGISIVFFCHDGAGRFLMMKRGPNARDEQGTWDIGSGQLEFGTTIEETLRAEIREEYGTDVLGWDFLGYRDVHRENNGKPTHWLGLDFKVRVDAEKAHNAEPHKIDEVGWFSFDALPAPLHSQVPRFFESYRSRL
jgi:8-oxo-dGTP pyrophosphatase MutT (NUDIX family)